MTLNPKAPTGITPWCRVSILVSLLAIVVPSSPLFGNLGHGGLIVTEDFVQATHDTVPRFANIPGAGAPISANVQSGNFSDPAIWPGGVVPGDEARIQIVDGTVVTYDLTRDTRLDCIEVQSGGHLRFATDQDTRLFLNELMVMPGGELTIGTVTQPVAEGVTAEIIFRGDTPLRTGTIENPGIDPKQYGKGLLVFGKATLHGRPMNETFLRFAKEPLAGETTLELEQAPTGWLAHDRLLIPDTRQQQFTPNYTFTSQAEEVEIASVAGNIVTLKAPLAFDHRGPRDVEGQVGPTELAMLPHVGNLTRNIILRSEVAGDVLRRGHTIYFHRAEVDLRYAEFRDLGRTSIAALDNTTVDGTGAVTKIGTNQIGRYSIHLHHLWGPHNQDDSGYQVEVVGNVMNGMRKWGMTVHNTHYGLFQGNIAYDGRGSAIATEEGNESFNVFERNFVVHTRAGDTQQILGHNPGRGGVFNTRKLFGTTRDAFWFSGEHNYVRDNVAANVPDFAYNYNGYYIKATMSVPRFRGADMTDPDEFVGWNFHESGQYFVEGRHKREGLPVLESARNEAYSSGQGLWLSWARGCCNVSYYLQESLFEDYRLWHINHSGVYAYHESRNTYRGFILRNDPNISLLSGPNARLNTGMFFGHTQYENGQLRVTDFDVQGFNIGIILPANPQDGTDEPNLTTLENGVLKNHVNLRELLPTITSGKATVIRNVHFTPTVTYQSNALPADPVNIEMSSSRNRNMHPMAPSQTLVYDFNGEPGNSFQLYFLEQAPDSLVPPPVRPDLHAGDPDVSCPFEGLTNTDCLEQFGVVTAGAIAPCVELDGGDCDLSRNRAEAVDSIGLHFPLASNPPAVLPYQEWRNTHFNAIELTNDTISGPQADPDGDGLTNLIEFALGYLPRAAEQNRLAAVRAFGDATSAYLLPKTPRPGITYQLEISNDLTNWRTGAENIQVIKTVDNGDGTESILFRAIGELENSNWLFHRLRITYQP